ncbi:MAG: hypothetical protein WAK28_18845, partial [Trebonia sp.]
ARGRSPTSSPSHEDGHSTRDASRPQPDAAPAGLRAHETHPQPGIISRTPPIADATQIIPICASLERLHDVSAAVQIGGYARAEYNEG